MRNVCLALTAIFLASCAPKYHYGHPPPNPGLPGSTPVMGQSCGGMVVGGNQTCGPHEFCRRTIGDYCGAADAPGICTPIPQACTMDYNPVCGCDGKTYPNECAANAKGVSAATAGECRS